ncbi:hypothetical protein DINM_007332 [Dirofilaria immitis]|nr:hypothetical protein [Dirofilaria immitis]
MVLDLFVDKLCPGSRQVICFLPLFRYWIALDFHQWLSVVGVSVLWLPLLSSFSIIPFDGVQFVVLRSFDRIELFERLDKNISDDDGVETTPKLPPLIWVATKSGTVRIRPQLKLNSTATSTARVTVVVKQKENEKAKRRYDASQKIMPFRCICPSTIHEAAINHEADLFARHLLYGIVANIIV